MLQRCFRIFLIILLGYTAWAFTASAEENLVVFRENLKKAVPGDYLVTAQNKSYTFLHIYSKGNDVLTLEEITVPARKAPHKNYSWKKWAEDGAPFHTSWNMYDIQLSTGEVLRAFSLTKNTWYEVPQSDHFFSTLLNLRFVRIPSNERKRVGLPSLEIYDRRPFWQPKVIVDGKSIEGVNFGAWRAHWPKDNSDLSGKTIEVFVPEDNQQYPAYFPYWLQINGMVGSAKIRIVDSGRNFVSPITFER